MKCTRFQTFLIIVILVSHVVAVRAQTSPSTVPPNEERALRIVKALQLKLDRARGVAQFPGAQVGFVFVDGETPEGRPHIISGSVATGVADLQTSVPMKTTDRLLAGSIGKTFVSALALQLVQESKLNLDDKISKWLGTESWFSQLPNAKDITLRMLLNHTSGIENHVDVGSFQKQLFKSAAHNIKHEELIAYVLNKKPLFIAGQGYNYGDTNYILAGMVIEKATGRDLYELITERFLRPLKLDRTIPSNSLTLPEVANGYLEAKPVVVGGKFTINPQWEWAGGGFASTAEDLARWGYLLYGGEVLPAASMDQLFTTSAIGEGTAYGLGAMITRSKWGRAYGHDGEFPGYVSDLRYYSKYKIAISVMVNSDETPGVIRFLDGAADDFAGIIIAATAQLQLSQAEQVKVRQLAENWLKLLDDGKYEENWALVSARLQARFSKAAWTETMRRFLDRAGKVKLRTFKSAFYSAPDSKSVAVDFESQFTKLDKASESVSLTLENGVWKVAGYTLR